MDVQNRLCPTRPLHEPRVLSGEPLVLGNQRRILVGLPPTPLGDEAGECRVVALLAPHEQVRRVEAFATEQAAELPQLCALVCLSQNAGLVLGVKPPPLGYSTSHGSPSPVLLALYSNRGKAGVSPIIGTEGPFTK